MADGKTLKKELRLLDVYAISTGATLSAGFFLLPGIAAETAGSAIVLAYLIAALPMIPAMFSVVELATAMPRAGGVYYFLDRSLGPMTGMIGGLGTWLALILKVAFALVGMGAYIALYVDNLPIKPVAIGLAIALGALNLFGTKKSGTFQVFLVAGLLVALTGFIGGGLPLIRREHFDGMLDVGTSSILSTAGFVYISYVGITKVASLSEEVKDPERVLPRSVFLSLGTAVLVYGLGTAVMVGLVPPDQLAGDLTPVATAAMIAFGPIGAAIISIAALAAFTSVANAGTLSASRYPLAMGRDHLMPRALYRLGKRGTPTLAIGVTVGLIILVLATLDVAKIAKLASAFQLLMFALVCLAVIVWRESGIDSYDPGYPSPFYPWMQIFGILSAFVLIGEMGWLPILFSGGLVVLSVIWFRVYARDRVVREGAIYHLFERLGRRRYEPLDTELRGILKEKGLRAHDPFDEIVARSEVLSFEDSPPFDDLVKQASQLLGHRTDSNADAITEEIQQGTRVGATPVTKGIALPHIRIPGLQRAEMVIVRSVKGVAITPDLPYGGQNPGQIAHAIFFLASPAEDPAQHLRILANLAGRVESQDFREEWFAAKTADHLREVVIHDDNFLTLRLRTDNPTSFFVGKRVGEVELPDETLIAIYRRHGETHFPKSSSVLEAGDRITIIGTRANIHALEDRFEV